MLSDVKTGQYSRIETYGIDPFPVVAFRPSLLYSGQKR